MACTNTSLTTILGGASTWISASAIAVIAAAGADGVDAGARVTRRCAGRRR